MKNCFKLVSSFILVGGMFAAIGCSEAKDEITNTANCGDVCQRYADCFWDDFDVSDCTDRCEAEADASETREERLETCNSCIDDTSCAEGTFKCGAQCAGVIDI